MRAIKDTLATILSAAGLGDLPPWAVPLVALVVAALLTPWFLKNERTKRARRLLRDASDLPFEDRRALESEALALVQGHRFGLIAVAEEAHRRGMRATSLQALANFQTTPRASFVEVRKLELKLLGPPPRTLEGALEEIRGALEADHPEEARLKLRRARRRWPRAAPLSELSAELPRSRTR